MTAGPVPDFPQTRLALRVWRFNRDTLALLSLNAPPKKASWMAKAMAGPEGSWPRRGVLTATCRFQGYPDDDGHDDPVPGQECSCGIYATTDLDIISSYLTPSAPVLGVVELGGRVIPATQGYRAAYARVAAVLLIDDAITEPHPVLRRVADAYRVPAVVPHSADPEAYRDIIGGPSLAAETEEWLKNMGGASA